MRTLYLVAVVGALGCGGNQVIEDEPEDTAPLAEPTPSEPKPAPAKRPALTRTSELPKAVRNTLRRPMQHHGENLENLMWSTVTLDYESVAAIAEILRNEPKLSRSTESDTLNRFIPVEFFDLQDELHAAAAELATAARKQNEVEMAEAYGHLTVTCVRCHSLYLKMPSNPPQQEDSK